MDDLTKKAAAAAKSLGENPKSRKQAGESFLAFMDDSSERAGEEAQRSGEPGSTSVRALDRWFRQRQKNRGSRRMLEIPNEALVRSGGPLQITGNITLVKEDGSIQQANHLTLCRCGHSRSKPGCDEQHLEMEFLNTGKISEISEVPASKRPSTITMSCIKDGPITFRGRLRFHNEFGQECVKMRGSLCRCGQSANKPFCDGSHLRAGFKSGSG